MFENTLKVHIYTHKSIYSIKHTLRLYIYILMHTNPPPNGFIFSVGFMFPLISVATHNRFVSADASCYQRQCLTISKLLLSVTESLEYFPITPLQRCAALMSLPVLCVHLIANLPSLCFTYPFSCQFSTVSCSFNAVIAI